MQVKKTTGKLWAYSVLSDNKSKRHFVTETLKLNNEIFYDRLLRRKLPVNAAKPATSAPMTAVASMSRYGLSIFSISMETLCDSICSLALLIQKLNAPHKKKRARKPAKNALPGFWGMTAATKKAARAILHQGRNKQAAKLNMAVSNKETMNFIMLI